MKKTRTAKGVEIFHHDDESTAHRNVPIDFPQEVAVLHQEIFEDEVYCPPEIQLNSGDIVFDIGAHIGMASVYFALERGARVYAFEPGLDSYEALQRNFDSFEIPGQAWRVAISESNHVGKLTYFRHGPSGSTLVSVSDHPGVIKLSQKENISLEQAERRLRDMFTPEIINCQCWTLSRAIKEAGVSKIDLLKIDAEHSELAILNGIQENDWEKIGQVVAEVHDINGRLGTMGNLLGSNGFSIFVRQEERFKGSEMYMISARRYQN